jgi:hypothetical protein
MSDVVQHETTTLVLGGPAGPMNLQAQALLNRTEYLNGFAARNNTYTKAQRGAFVALTSTSASIAVDLGLSNNFNHTLTENTTLAAPTNKVAGQRGVIHLTQHASAPKTLGYNAFWKFAGGTLPTLTATNGAIDVLSYVVNPAGTSAFCSLAKDVK